MEGILITVALLLLTIIIGIVSYMIYNIKMAGMEVNDFWDFIKSVEKLKKLYAFSKIYENLDIQEQIIFIKEAEQVFSAFEKVPTKLWVNRYQKEKLKHWKITQNDKEVRFNRGSINIRINKIIGILIILTIFIHMIKNTNIIYTISRIREII